MSGWIGVDLDGTLAHYDGWQGLDNVGAPIRPMCARVRAWIAEGKEVRIFTARVTEVEEGLSGIFADLADVRAPIDAFCMREFGRKLRITNVKDFGMTELWDDRAVRVVANRGEPCCGSHR